MGYPTQLESLVNSPLLGCVMQQHLHSSTWSFLGFSWRFWIWWNMSNRATEVSVPSLPVLGYKKCSAATGRTLDISNWTMRNSNTRLHHLERMKYVYFLQSQCFKQTGSRNLASWYIKYQYSFPVGLVPMTEWMLLSGIPSDLMHPVGWYWLVQITHKSDNPPVHKEEMTTALSLLAFKDFIFVWRAVSSLAYSCSI